MNKIQLVFKNGWAQPKSVLLSTGFFFLYIIVSTLVDEVHPFSRYPMYDSFPNYAYSFYVTDGKRDFVPFRDNFKIQGNEVAHIYCEICDNHRFSRGWGMETTGQLDTVGKELLTHILLTKKSSFVADSLCLHRLYYYFDHGKIVIDDRQLCQAKVD